MQVVIALVKNFIKKKDSIIYFGGDIEKVIDTKSILLKDQIDISMESNLLLKSGAKAHFYANFKKSSMLPILLSVNIQGENGNLYCNNLLAPSYYHYITYNIKNETKNEKIYDIGETTYYFQLKAFCEEINNGKKCETTPEESLKIMSIIDQVYLNNGLKIRPSKILEKYKKNDEEKNKENIEVKDKIETDLDKTKENFEEKNKE
jgi:hypothetical protein